MLTRYSISIALLAFGIMSLGSFSVANESVVNKPGVTAPTKNTTAKMTAEKKSCSEALTKAMALELEEQNQNWKATVSLCQTPGQTHSQSATLAQTIESYNKFLTRFQTSLDRSHQLYGEHLISSGLTELTDSKAAVDEKYTQSLQAATNLHTRNKELFCDERLFKLKQDMLSVTDEAALCKKLEALLAERSQDRSLDQDKIEATSMKPSKVADENGAAPMDEEPLSPWRPPSSSTGGGNGVPLASQSGDFSSLSSPSDRETLRAQEFTIPGGANSPMEDFFSESLRKSRERALARSTSECLSQNTQSATQTYWTLRSRVKAAATNCEAQAGIDWKANWSQFANSNPVTMFKPQLPPGITEKEFEQEQVRLAQQRLSEQRRICENANFQRDFQEAVRLNSAQIEDQIAESLCEIKTE